MKIKISQEILDQIQLTAVENGWNFLCFQENIKMISFKKEAMRINYYISTGTLGTCLDHPKKGKTQLFRKNVGMGDLKRFFKNPRSHTGKGYYRK